MRLCGGVPLFSLFLRAAEHIGSGLLRSPCNNCRRHVLDTNKVSTDYLLYRIFYIYTFCFLFFLRRLCGGGCFVFIFMLMFILMFMFVLCLYLYPCFCFSFSFCFCLCFSLSVSVLVLISVCYFYLSLSRVFVSYRREVVRFPVDLSGRGTEQRFCVFYPHFPSSVRRGAASDRVVCRKHGYSAQ